MTQVLDAPAVEARSPEDHPPGAPHRPPFALLGRVAAASWFVLLAAIYGRTLMALVHATPSGAGAFAAWAPVVSRGCAVVFFLIQAWLMMIRPPALATGSARVRVAVALAGTYGIWVMAFLPDAALPPSLEALSAAITLLGSLSIIYVITCLGRSFSIAPQARALVTSGPYRLVRHPLYAAEEVAILGVAMHVVWWAAIPFLLAHIALQLRRMSYEESLLSTVFPDYADYARRTARLVPGVW
jgi:protein-S-isoprenylcysteine O-methyltransferase Ste14